MAAPDRRTDMIWLTALREVAQHFSKIGEVIAKCAEDSEKLMLTAAPPPFSKPLPNAAPGASLNEEPAPRRPAAWQRDKPPYRFNYPVDRPVAPPPGYMYYSHADPVPSPYLPHPAPRYTYPDEPSSDAHHRMRRKRRVSDEEVEYDHTEDRPGPRMQRPKKRVRVNWSEEEDIVFLDVIRNHASLDESGVLRKIVSALEGSRNWVQCKGHFRNLVVVGKIALREGPPKRWVVNDDTEPRRQDADSTGPDTGMRRPDTEVRRASSRVNFARIGDNDGQAEDKEKGRPGSIKQVEKEDGKVPAKGRSNGAQGEHLDSDEDEDDEHGRSRDSGERDEDYIQREDPELDDSQTGDLDMPVYMGRNANEDEEGEDGDEVRSNGGAANSPHDKSINGRYAEDRNGSMGKLQVPHRKQGSSSKGEDGGKNSAFRRGKDNTKRRNTDYRGNTFSEGRHGSRNK